MGVWAAYVLPKRGPASVQADTKAAAETLRRLLGPDQGNVHFGADFGIGVTHGTGGEPVRLIVSPDGRSASAVIGDPQEAGCSISINACPSGPASAHAACDPFGLFSVFRARTGAGVTWYASDPRLLSVLPGIGKHGIDPAALHGYLCFSHVPTPLTIFAGVERVEERPALTYQDRTPPLPSIMGVPEGRGLLYAIPAPPLLRAGGAILLSHLRAAIQKRLGKDRHGEVGVYLSGGLDSSLIAALLKEAGVGVRLFTLDFGPPHDIELPFARAVAEHLGLPLHVVPARPREIRTALDATARALPQPFGDAVTVPLYLLGQTAKEYVGEIWNGEGGDQLFGGWANKPMVAAALHGSGVANAGWEVREYLATYHRFLGTTERMYSPAMRERTAGIDAAEWIRPALSSQAFPTLLHRLRAANLRLKGAQNIAPRCVALGECHGLRVRAPFFDRTLAEWTFTLPPEMFLSGACEKYLLKQVAEAYLPPEIVWREKRGMGAPAADWCLSRGFLRRSGPVRREARRRLSPRRVRQVGWFDPAFVSALLRGEDPTPEAAFRNRRIGEKIWTLLMLEAWREAHSSNP